ncbi:helix-turn-helix domain-containing protein [Paenibacillus sp. NPDC056579]
MLLQSDMSVTDIALTLGYNNVSLFIQQFSKNIGLTPHKFRCSNR